MNNETNNTNEVKTESTQTPETITEEQKAASEVLMPGIPEYLIPDQQKPQAQPEQVQAVQKKKSNKKMLLFIVLGILVVLIGVVVATTLLPSTPSGIPIPGNNNVDIDEKIKEIKSQVLTSMKDKTIEIKDTIKEIGNSNYEIGPLGYNVFLLDVNNIANYDVSLTSSDSLKTFYIRYYNMDYNYVDLETLNRYDKLYLLVINTSTINTYNYEIDLNTKKTYDLTKYNNYAIKISYTADTGDVSKLTPVNAIYDEVHQRKYIRIPVVIQNIGNATKLVYEDIKTNSSYSKSPTSAVWYKDPISKPKMNLKSLDDYIKGENEGVKKVNNFLYNMVIKKDQILPYVYDIEPLEEANSTITLTNDRISKITYEFGNNIEGYENLVMTIEISAVNTSGDVVIPDEALK